MKFTSAVRLTLGLTVIFFGLFSSLVSAAKPVAEYGKLPEEIFPDLGNILKKAMETSPRVLVAQLRQLESEALAQANRSNLYPHVRAHGFVTGNLEDRNDLPDLQTRANTVFGVTASQGIFHWGALEAQREIGRIRYELESGNSYLAYQDLAREIRTAYLNLVLDKMLLDQSKTDLELAETLLRRDEENFQKNLISGDQWKTLQLNHRESILRSKRTQNLVEDRLRLFRLLTGIENFSMDRLPQFFPEIPLVDETISVLKQEINLLENENVTPIHRYNLELAIQEQELRSLRANLLPKVDLEAGINQDFLSSANSDANVRRLSFFAGVRVNWNIFDGFRTRYDRLANLHRTRRLQEEKFDLVATRRNKAITLLNELDFFTQTLAIHQERFGLQRKEFERQERELKEGRISQSGFLQASYGFQGQRIALAEARMNYLIQWAEFISFFELDPIVTKQ